VLSALGLAIREVVLVEQSRPEMEWPLDVILGTGSSTVLSGHWRAFALSHQLLVGNRLVFRFKLGVLDASVRVSMPTASAAPTLFWQRRSEDVMTSQRPSGGGYFFSSPSF
jgi:hypothetical protein